MLTVLLTCMMTVAPNGAYQQAIADFYAGQWDKALQGFAAESLGTNAGTSAYNMAAIKYLQGNYVEARNLLETVTKAKGPGEIYIVVGNAWLAERDPLGRPLKNATNKATEMFNHLGKTALADHCKAAALYLNGNYGGAWDKIKDYVINTSTCPASTLALGALIRKEMKRPDEALGLMGTAAAKADAPEQVFIAYGSMLEAMGKTQMIDDRIRIAQTKVQMRKGQTNVAYNILAPAGNGNPEILYLRASTAGMLGRYNEAKTNLESCLANSPSEELAVKAKVQYVVVLYYLSDAKGIYDYLMKEARNMYTKLPPALPSLGAEDGLLTNDNLKTIIAWLKGNSASDPKNPYGPLNHATILTLAGQYSDAAFSFADGLNRISNLEGTLADNPTETYRQVMKNVQSATSTGVYPDDLFTKNLVGINLFGRSASTELLYYLP